MAFSMPVAIINLFLVWIILSLIFLGRPDYTKRKRNTEPNDTTEGAILEDSSQNVAKLLRRKLDELGETSFHEIVVIVLITVAVLLWLFRDPRVIPGWITFFPDTYPRIGDATVAIAILILMFIIPKEIKYFRGGD